MKELSLHIMDMVQNSVEAGADLVYIGIEERSAADEMKITIEDNGKGMSALEVDWALMPYYTSKEDGTGGLGLPLFRNTARRSGGDLSISSLLSRGTRVEAVLKLSHPDRPPLGRMAATIQVLIAAYPELDIEFCHTVDSRSLHFSTIECRQEIDIPLSDPAVLDGIGRLIAHEAEALYQAADATGLPSGCRP